MEAARRKVAAAIALLATAALARADEAKPAPAVAWRPFPIALRNHALCAKYHVVLLRGSSAKPAPEEVRGTFLADDPGIAKLRDLSLFSDVPAGDALGAELRKRAELDGAKTCVVIIDCDGERIEKALTEPTPEQIRDAVRVFAMYTAPKHAEGKLVKRAEPAFELAAPPGWTFVDVGEDAVLVAKEIEARAEVRTAKQEGGLAEAEETARALVERRYPGTRWSLKPKYAAGGAAKKTKGSIEHAFSWKGADDSNAKAAGALCADFEDGTLAVAIVTGKPARAKALDAQAEALAKALRAGLARDGTKK